MSPSKNPVLRLLVLATVTISVVNAVTQVETAACGKTVTLADCIQKTLICSPLDNLLSPLLGDPATIASCSMKAGVPLKGKFYAALGQSVASGGSFSSSSSSSSSSDSGILDQLTSNSVADAAIRQCVLNSTGMLTPTLALDRAAIAEQVSLLSPPSLGAAVVGAVETCPEPINYKISTFIRCLKKVCIAAAAIPTAAPSFSGLPSFF